MDRNALYVIFFTSIFVLCMSGNSSISFTLSSSPTFKTERKAKTRWEIEILLKSQELNWKEKIGYT